MVIRRPHAVEETRSYVEAMTPELAERIEIYDGTKKGHADIREVPPNQQLVKALDRKVWLPSGRSSYRAHRRFT